MIAAPNPLRSPAADAAALGDLLRTVDGPVVLVGHSYGGMVISNVPADAGQITGLVYVCAFAPEPGDTCNALPSWFLIGEQDHTIPAALHRFMAERAGARRVLEIPGASHAAAVSHPEETAELILQAAALPAAA